MFARQKARYIVYIVALVMVFSFLNISLHGLTTQEKEEYQPNIKKGGVETLSVAGTRGSIYDANGVLLAYDVKSYDVEFYRDPANNASSDRARYTSILMEAIEIIERGGGKMIDSFTLKKNEDGSFGYNLEGLSDAQKESRIEGWLDNMQVVDREADPEDIYYELRSRFRIPEEADYTLARKLLSIWQEVQMNMYQSHIPVTIATNISFETVAELEAKANELLGIRIVTSSTRVYPKGESAAHIIGYLGRIDDTEIEEKEALGYTEKDLIGKAGIEASMEGYLSGATSEKRGTREVKTDDKGSIIEEISFIKPKQGNNVVLTIDMGLQEVAEKALAENILQINKEQKQQYAENKYDYDKILTERQNEDISYIEAGAAIVMEVKTGNILAMVSYPAYDLNLFVGGISQADYQALLDAPGAPLFDKAISSTSTPGSIFKMVTATAGLMEGVISVNTHITDEGPYNKYVTGDGVAPECWVAPYFSSHGSQNVSLALKNSCNYFFYDVADRLGIERLKQWTDNYGLLSKTNVELTNEKVGWIGEQAVIYDATKPISEQKTYRPQLVYNKLIEQLRQFGIDRGVNYNDAQTDAAALGLMALTEEAAAKDFKIGAEIREVLSRELDIPDNIALRRGWTLTIMDTIRELIWTSTDTVTQGIGATPTELTPIAVARYMCAVGNGGKVYDAHLVDKIIDQDNKVVEDITPTLVRDLALPTNYLNALFEGMESVVSLEDGGTAGRAFADFEYKDIIMGKTGTAPVSRIDLEDNIWLCLLAPRTDPEIAVVIFLPNGLSDTKGFPTAKTIVSHYFNTKYGEQTTSPEEGTLVN